jgi:hypothetical protein
MQRDMFAKSRSTPPEAAMGRLRYPILTPPPPKGGTPYAIFLTVVKCC